MTPATLTEVESATGLSCRETVPDWDYGFLRCQLGRYEVNDEDERVFRLIAHGRNWEETYREFKLKMTVVTL